MVAKVGEGLIGFHTGVIGGLRAVIPAVITVGGRIDPAGGSSPRHAHRASHDDLRL